MSEIEELRLLIQAELDRELTRDESSRLEEACVRDADLARERRELQQLSRLFEDDRESLRPPLGLAQRVLDSVQDHKNPAADAVPQPAAKSFPFRAFASAAAILVVVVSSFYLGRGSTSAKADDLRADLMQRRAVILDENPGIDSHALEALYEKLWRDLDGIDAEARERTRAVLGKLEREIEVLIRRQRGR